MCSGVYTWECPVLGESKEQLTFEKLSSRKDRAMPLCAERKRWTDLERAGCPRTEGFLVQREDPWDTNLRGQ